MAMLDGIDRTSEPAKVRFWAQAWKAAHQKALAVDGAKEVPYDLPNIRVEYVREEPTGIPRT